MSAGKGDKPRPTDKKTFDQNFDQIDWNSAQSKPFSIKKGKKTFTYSSKQP